MDQGRWAFPSQVRVLRVPTVRGAGRERPVSTAQGLCHSFIDCRGAEGE